MSCFGRVVCFPHSRMFTPKWFYQDGRGDLRVKIGQLHRGDSGQELTVLFQRRESFIWKEIARFHYSELHQVRQLMDLVDRYMSRMITGHTFDEPAQPESQ